MVEICMKCGNYDWDKTVEGNQITCPKCGHTWTFRKLPLFVLTGCSGVGKTTTAHALMQKQDKVVVLDADYFNFMPHKTQEDYERRIEMMEELSKDIMQSGKPVLWAMAGNLDKLNGVYQRKFFPEIHCLALVCSESSLRKRMQEGRGITDPGWIQSSVDYNRYFQTHTEIGDLHFDVCDIEGKNTDEAADMVQDWICKKLT